MYINIENERFLVVMTDDEVYAHNKNLRENRLDGPRAKLFSKAFPYLLRENVGDIVVGIVSDYDIAWHSINQELKDFLVENGVNLITQPKLSYFPSEEGVSEKSYNDGLSQRSRSSMCILYTKNWAVKFDGSDIPNICTVGTQDHTKDGKWSSTTFQLFLASGVKMSTITQDWNSGEYVTDVNDLEVMKSQLGISCNPSALRNFLQTFLPRTWERHQELQENIAKLEETLGDVEMVEYEFNQSYATRRKGHLRLVVDGEVFCHINNPMPTKITITNHVHSSGRGGGDENFNLLISADAEIDEVYEGDLHFNGEKYTVEGETENENETGNGNNPFGGLSNLFK
jgi:hypothetical protein